MKKLLSNEIRQMWLDFFKSKGHMQLESASLIPSDDKSLLWMNAGVTPLKKYFDGRKTPECRRITNAQKCIRTNDIENVGMTSRHHTFFEMLGNFSIGDYFKNEAIGFAYELLFSEEWFALPKDKLYITYYPTDTDTFNRWVECGIDPSHLVPCHGNFWEIGEGPCGPDSEMFFDRGDAYGPFDLKFLSDEIDNDRFIEIWNIVFSEFNSDGSGNRSEYKPLPSKNIDTGCGLERLCCIFQGTKTNFETDLFMPIINEVSKLTGKAYDESPSFKIIADHLRTIVFALSDGALFSNEGRGYVLRRLLRRAVKHAIKLGIKKPFLYELVDIVVSKMDSFYPELDANKELIKKLIKLEEEKFLKTIDDGVSKLKDLASQSEKIISGKDAFTLFDTFGFPIELTVEYADELGLSVDLDGYKEEMAKAKELSKSSKSSEQSFAKQNKEFLAYTEELSFSGYEVLEEKEATITHVFEEGFTTDVTPFYAVCGGQVGDTGVVVLGGREYAIVDTLMLPHKQHLHVVENPLLFHVGDKVSLRVDKERRNIIESNHSSAHLMFKALREVLGHHVSQQGSLVSNEVCRFDFNHYSMPTDEELIKVEDMVNEFIAKSYKKDTQILTLDEARTLGAIAEFGEKYESKVRVVNLGATIDVCGGTHVSNTADIKKFMIVKVFSIGSGIYRVVALSNDSIKYEAQQYKSYIDLAETLVSKGHEIVSKNKEEGISLEFNPNFSKELTGSYRDLLRMQNELSSLQESIKNLEKQARKAQEEAFEKNMSKYDEIVSEKGGILITDSVDKSNARTLIDHLSSIKNNTLVVMIIKGDANSVLVKSNNPSKEAGTILKEALGIVNGRGGGNKEFAQGGFSGDVTDSLIDFFKGKINE